MDEESAWEDISISRDDFTEVQPVDWLTPCDLVASEAWFSEKIANEFTAAYLAGRLLNCLDWMAVRLASYGKPDRNGLNLILGRLAELSHVWDTTGDAPIREAVERVDREWRQWLGSEEYRHWCDCTSELLEDDRPFSDEGWAKTIHASLHDRLDSRERDMVELGRCVDQGIRPTRSSLAKLTEFFAAIESQSAVQDALWEGDLRGLSERVGINLDVTSDKSLGLLLRVAAIDVNVRTQLSLLGKGDFATPLPPDARATSKPLTRSVPEAVDSPDLNGVAPIQVIDPREYKRLLEIKEKIVSRDTYIGKSLPILRMFERIHLLNQAERKPATLTKIKASEETKSFEAPGHEKPVLLLGETGAGKTVVARLIHNYSGRKGLFMELQASETTGTDESLIRHYWVGHGKNSPVHGSDPKQSQDGILQQCSGGTIFLDELHDVPKAFQTFLLKIIDRREMHRSSGIADPFQPDVRLIFASNKKLDALEGCLKHDLLDRIRRRHVDVPPLKDRKEDIPSFVEQWCAGYDRDSRFSAGPHQIRLAGKRTRTIRCSGHRQAEGRKCCIGDPNP